MWVFKSYHYLLLCLFPLSAYIGLKWTGFSRFAAAAGGASASLISCLPDALFGFEWASYSFSGYGLYSQLFAMFFLLPAAGALSRFIRKGEMPLATILLSMACFLSQIIYGYILGVTALLLTLFTPGPGGLLKALKRLLLLGVCMGILLSFFIAPFMTEKQLLARSVWEHQWKWDSYGHRKILNLLMTGQLLDGERLPVLTIAATLGFLIALIRRKSYDLIAVTLFTAWLLIYFGRPTWGPLLKLFPLSHSIPWHRFIAGVHMSSLLLIGSCIAGISRLFRYEKYFLTRFLMFLAVVCLLAPCWISQYEYMKKPEGNLISNRNYIKRDINFREAYKVLTNGLEGRAYAGMASNWGKTFKTGHVPVYAVLSRNSIDNLGYLYMAMSLNTDFQVQFNDLRTAHYRIYNIQRVIAPAGRHFHILEPYSRIGRFQIYEAPGGGWFDLIKTPIALCGDQASRYPFIKTWMNGGWPERKIHAAVFEDTADAEDFPVIINTNESEALLPPPTKFNADFPGEVFSETVESQVYCANVETPKPCVLMFKMTYHPQWIITVDGKQTSHFMVTPAMTGIRLQPGKHHVVCRYDPGALKNVLTIVCCLLLILLIPTKCFWSKYYRSLVS